MELPDPLVVGRRLLQLIHDGSRASSYKIATTTALLDHCVEHVPGSPGDVLEIDIRELADRVIDLYWPQTVPFSARGPLRQNEQRGRGILDMVAELRATEHGRSMLPLQTLRESAAPAYLALRDDVAVRIADMPLRHLQNIRGAEQAVLYEHEWLRHRVSRRVLQEREWQLNLLPGAAWSLVQLAALLRPALELAWERFVAQLNRDVLDVADLNGFLFGADRTALTRLAPRLAEAQRGACFYCSRPMVKSRWHVDHVVPWSTVPLDGVANLVLADASCNMDKAALLPVPEHVERALNRSAHVMRDMGEGLLPVLLSRVSNVASGLYRTIPTGTPLWEARSVYRIYRAAPREPARLLPQ